MHYKDLALEAARYQGVLSEIRRDLHQIPEFGLQLPKTLERVLSSIHGLGEITVSPNISAAALVIEGAKPGPTVLLRADMDALEVAEATGLDFASTNGFMHACGHDLHMAMGIGASHLLHTHRDKLAGKVVVWFQPGEEGHGGADIMIEEGMLDVSGERPIAAYGIHVFSAMHRGLFATKPGPLMASAGDLIVTFKGQSGHGSMPWLSRDPVSAMTEAMTALQTMVAKRFNAFDPVIINIGWIRAGETATTNVIPETASFGATVRTFSAENSRLLKERTAELLDGIANAFGVEVSHEFSSATKVLINDGEAVDRVERISHQMFGEQRFQRLTHPIAGGEDFASIVELVPGAFVFLGATPDGIVPESAATNHSNHALFDESVMPDGAALLAALAFDTLGVS